MKARVLLCLALLTAAHLPVGAQTAADAPAPRPVLPPGPVLGTAPDFAAWTIVLQAVPGLHEQPAEIVARRATSSASPDSLTSVTKTGPVRCSVRKLKTGQEEDIWYEHGNRITMESSWKIPMFEVATAPAGQPLGPDFPELGWIAPGNFVGTQHYQDTDYFVFETQVSDINPAMAKVSGYKPTTILNRAYINADTRFPWLLQTGDSLYRYVFQAPPTNPLEAPPEYQTMFDTFEKKKAEARARKSVAP